MKRSTDQLHNLSVQGPKSRDLLEQIVWTLPAQPAFEELTWFRFAIGRIGDHRGIPIMVSRTGYSGELGYELWCHPKDGLALWDAVWEAGEPFGLTPLGLDALDVLRIEAGLSSPATSSTTRSAPSRPASASRSPPARRTTSSARRLSMSGAPIRSGSLSGSSWRATSQPGTASASTSAVRPSA